MSTTISVEAEALLNKLGFTSVNGIAVKLPPPPATRKMGAVQHLSMETRGVTTTTRGKLFAKKDNPDSGYSITAVIRWCGQDGWEFAQVRKMLLEMGAGTIADTTIRIQLTAGRKKDLRRGDVPSITDFQAKTLRSAGGKK